MNHTYSEGIICEVTNIALLLFQGAVSVTVKKKGTPTNWKREATILEDFVMEEPYL